ncbi:hypothetical protein CANCADRAFT_45230 [Tortispora caseinolytica NRRL Y-17796]|uniref:Methyltransferase type 11 domain-containing protein n=1 Tax=Tortispora caseinolytica NRRL Y-17796 TaxID=767744 RepID=A0A1E4TAK3_9ASCO|nr:hypothetical protein CANCADRAFT_45230 [Tortispora caseinolytica NRRL Y-17796]
MARDANLPSKSIRGLSWFHKQQDQADKKEPATQRASGSSTRRGPVSRKSSAVGPLDTSQLAKPSTPTQRNDPSYKITPFTEDSRTAKASMNVAAGSSLNAQNPPRRDSNPAIKEDNILAPVDSRGSGSIRSGLAGIYAPQRAPSRPSSIISGLSGRYSQSRKSRRSLEDLKPTVRVPTFSSNVSGDTSSFDSNPTSDYTLERISSEQRQQLWESFLRFEENTLVSDAVTYGQIRKEAWLQHTHTFLGKSLDSETTDLWLMTALRYFFNGQHLFSPAKDDITLVPKGGKARHVLDIQGLVSSQWTWQIALDHPSLQIFGLQFQHARSSQPSISSSDNSSASFVSAEQGVANTISGETLATSTTTNSAARESELSQDAEELGGLYGPTNYQHLYTADLCALPFPDDFFDVITSKSIWYLLRTKDIGRFMKEVYRVLKPGGYVEMIGVNLQIMPESKNEMVQEAMAMLKSGLEEVGLSVDSSEDYLHAMKECGLIDINEAHWLLPLGWGGSIRHVSEFIGFYYLQVMFSNFTRITRGHMTNLFHYLSTSEARGEPNVIGLSLGYGQKPLSK